MRERRRRLQTKGFTGTLRVHAPAATRFIASAALRGPDVAAGIARPLDGASGGSCAFTNVMPPRLMGNGLLTKYGAAFRSHAANTVLMVKPSSTGSTNMSQSFMFYPASESVLKRTGQAIARRGFDPEAFRVVLVELSGSFGGGMDRWNDSGLVEVSVVRPYTHTNFYRRSDAWLNDFERDLDSGGFDGPTEKPPRLTGAPSDNAVRTLWTEPPPTLHLRSPEVVVAEDTESPAHF